MRHCPLTCQTFRTLLAGALLAGTVAAHAAPPPAGAVIAEVRGIVTAGAAEVVWTTQSQEGTAGFRLSRRDGESWTALHAGWLPVDIRLNGGGQVYRVRDPARNTGDMATYLLEEALADGDIRRLGEWPVRFEVARPLPLNESEPAPLEAGGAPLQEPLSGPSAKIPIAGTTNFDIFAVTYASLGAVLGLSESEVADLAAQALLRMRCGNVPVAYLPDAANNRLLFYGWPTTNRYTRTNYFWIEPGAGLHMAALPTEDVPVANDQHFQSLRDFEMDRYVHVDVNALRDDLFYWDFVTSKPAGDASAEKAFPVPLDGYAGGPVTVSVRFIGFSDNKSFDPDHRVQLYFNGALRQTVEFEGTAEAVASFTVDEGDVLGSGNELRLRGVLYPGQSTSYPLVDGYSVAYRRYYAPAADLTRASDGGNARLRADRFSDAVVLNITDPYLPAVVGDFAAGIPVGHSWPAAPGTTWAFRERTAITTLAPEPGGGGAWLRAATNRVDYVVIAPRDFETPARELADYRAGQGLRTALAFVEDIYDQFGGGLKTPDAIRAFLIYAQQNWTVSPWLVALAARGHHDYLNGVVSEPNRIPALLVYVPGGGGLKPADGLYADTIGNDGVPDIAVGRIPARTATELQNYIAKLKAYEALGPRPYHDRAVFVADRDDPDGGFFTETNALLAAEASPRYTPEFWSLNTQSVSTVRTGALAAFTGGSGLLLYTGHGTHSVVASASDIILQNSDFNAMNSPQLPVFIALSCLIARFDHMSTVHLGEKAVLCATGGAVAIYAPTSYSWNSFAEQLGIRIFRAQAAERLSTLGLALVRAREQLGGGAYSEALRTYTLLGDPALKLGGGGGAVPVSPAVRTFAAWRWERFSMAQLADPVVSGPQADAPGRSWSNFLDYAHGGESPTIQQFETDPLTGRGHIEWTQRIRADDVEYRLWVTPNLQEAWQPAPPDTVLYRTPQADGITERVKALIPFDGDRLFVKLEPVEK